jgi:hypothetical protein
MSAHLSDKGTSEQKLNRRKQLISLSRRRVIWAEEAASEKALRLEHA